MAHGKDFWDVNLAKVGSFMPLSSKYAAPSPTYDYTSPIANLSLTEALDKPLYEFNSDELHDLVSELKAVRWAEKETQVREIVRNFMLEYQSHASNPAYTVQTNTDYITMTLPVHGFRTVPRALGASTPSTLHSTANHVRISIPTSIPREFVHPFVERMVRDYFEEG